MAGKWIGPAILLATIAVPVTAENRPAAFLQFGGHVDAPRGFAEMCASDRVICDKMAVPSVPDTMAVSMTAQEPSAALPLPMMPAKVLKAMLKRVNAKVNANVNQQSDDRIYGRAELWRPSGGNRRATGDCEDMAIQKRLELIDAKFPADRLFFAIVYRSGVGLHTVLVARLDDGDVVLDSRVNYIQKWSDAGYSWVSAQSPTAPGVWRALV